LVSFWLLFQVSALRLRNGATDAVARLIGFRAAATGRTRCLAPDQRWDLFSG
jgi:hypothetical protein